MELSLFVELLTQMYRTISEFHHHLCQFTELSLWRNFICGTSKSDIQFIIHVLCLIIIFVNLQSYLYGGILFVELLTQMYGIISESHHHLCEFMELSLRRNLFVLCGTSNSDVSNYF